jgi:hypothetical protein
MVRSAGSAEVGQIVDAPVAADRDPGVAEHQEEAGPSRAEIGENRRIQ